MSTVSWPQSPAEAWALVLEVAREPVVELTDPGRRVFWGYLLTSMVLGTLALAARGISPWTSVRALFDRRIWLHPSALADVRLITLRWLLSMVPIGVGTVSTLTVVLATSRALRSHLGVPEWRVSGWVVGVLFTVVVYLAQDWSRYAVHRAMHRVPALWAFHKVHHSAEVLTPLTLYRTHPVEVFLNRLRGVVVLGVVTGLFVWCFGARSVRAWQVWGVEALGVLWSLSGANLRHSQVWLSYGRRVEHVFLSPAQHQIHHSVDERHYDRNFGSAIALWDWIGGSLYTTTSVREPIHYGLRASEQASATSATAMLVQPFAELWRMLGARWRRSQGRHAPPLEPPPAE